MDGISKATLKLHGKVSSDFNRAEIRGALIPYPFF